jgi:hypothetical protein
MLRKLSGLVIVLLFAVTPPTTYARPIMDCYPGMLMPVRGTSYSVCWIDSDNECMYCQVRDIAL